MKNKINISELLKDCPKDMELDCVMYEDVYFDYVDELNIIHCYIQYKTHKTSITFNQHGTPNGDIKSKCVIFPKGKTTWEGFVPPCKLKDGDIVYIKATFDWVCIYKETEDTENFYKYVAISPSSKSTDIVYDKVSLCRKKDILKMRIATEEEKLKLFKAIKDNGYKWNPETKTLEELPKFKSGDVVVDDSGAIFIYKQIHTYYEEPYADFYCGVTSELRGFVIKTGEGQRCGKISSIRYATEEEKQILFNAIKERGYRWNHETKTLEKLPKFKIGDEIVKKNSISNSYLVISVSCDFYGLKLPNNTGIGVLKVNEQDDWELIHRIKPIFKKGDKVRSKKGFPDRIARIIEDVCDTFYTLVSVGKIDFTDQDNWELVPNKFNINTLVPFESKVLVRGADEGLWKPAIYGFSHSNGHYVVGGACWKQCIPYKGNEHLRGTTNVCDDYFKTWEE